MSLLFGVWLVGAAVVALIAAVLIAVTLVEGDLEAGRAFSWVFLASPLWPLAIAAFVAAIPWLAFRKREDR